MTLQRSTEWNAHTHRRRNVPLSPHPKHAQGTRASLKAELDRLTSLIVRARDGRRCVLCGSRKRIEAGHIFGRAHPPVRFDFDNLHAQCRACNKAHNRNHEPYIFWFCQRFGQGRFAALCERCFSERKFSHVELEEMVARYTRIWQAMQRGISFEEATA